MVGVLDVGVWGSFELRIVIVNCSSDFLEEVWVTKTFAILTNCNKRPCVNPTVAKNLLWVSALVCCLICGQNVVIEIM